MIDRHTITEPLIIFKKLVEMGHFLSAKNGTLFNHNTNIQNLRNNRFQGLDGYFVFLIFKEAIDNAFKHADARQVELVLNFDNKDLNLLLSDDGCGFDCVGSFYNHSLGGLNNIRSYVQHITGQLELSSAVDRGTTINFHQRIGVQ